MKSKDSKRVLKKLQIEIPDDEADGQQSEPRGRDFEQRSTNKPPRKISQYDLSMGFNLLKIFAKGFKRRLKMQCFMRLKFLYGLTMQRMNSHLSSSQKLETLSSRNRMSTHNILEQSAHHSLSRAKLLGNIMGKLQETSNSKVQVQRASDLLEMRNTERSMSIKLDNLERMLKDIQGDGERTRGVNNYARKRARAKGEKYPHTTEFKVKPYSAVLPKTESSLLDQNKTQQSVPKLTTFQDTISPIEEKSQTSSNIYELHKQQEQTKDHTRSKQKFVDQIQQISKELSELKKINEQYIAKNTVILHPQEPINLPTFRQHVSGYNHPPLTKPSYNNFNSYIPTEGIKSLEQPLPQQQIIYIRNGNIIRQERQNPHRLFGHQQNAESEKNLRRKPATQSQMHQTKNQAYTERTYNYPSYAPPSIPLSKNAQSQPYLITNNNRSRTQLAEPYQQQAPSRHVRYYSSSGPYVDNRPLYMPYPQQIKVRYQHPQY